MLVHAQSVKATFSSYLSIIGFVVVEIFALVDQNAVVGDQHGDVARMLIDHVTGTPGYISKSSLL